MNIPALLATFEREGLTINIINTISESVRACWGEALRGDLSRGTEQGSGPI